MCGGSPVCKHPHSQEELGEWLVRWQHRDQRRKEGLRLARMTLQSDGRNGVPIVASKVGRTGWVGTGLVGTGRVGDRVDGGTGWMGVGGQGGWGDRVDGDRVGGDRVGGGWGQGGWGNRAGGGTRWVREEHCLYPRGSATYAEVNDHKYMDG